MPKKKSPAATEREEPISHGEIRDAISVLEQALFNHVQWTDALNITLICHLRPDERDLSPNAHRECRLGQWYYNENTRVVRTNPNFTELEEAHREVHRRAAHLLGLSASRQEIPMADYEQFTHELKRLRLQIETLKRELEDEIYNVDELTGASTRVGMLTKLREQHELVKRKLETCAIVMMDIDKFKDVNDTYGHSIGDQALATFAHHVMRNTRPFDRLFRYGGEEFLLYAPHTDMISVRRMIERIRSELEKIEIISPGYAPFFISASFGIAILDPDVPVMDSIERADLAVYAAKARGRNRTVIWDPSLERAGTK
ncbi:diguanylate cyclase domain-containing protein [Parvibaculum sedimenti]|uniref:diguanylate cyclase domain-containing protein n=1 Tax=Parvibaculum sedimenti TaxID=2608632 RepID=UPI0016395832|nr:diguanylate cyclase [Parvibaculum sedimenti]